MSDMNIVEKQPLTDEYLKKMDAYWRAANYLGAAQLYLLDNPLLREPLTMEQENCWSLGNCSGTELCICTLEPGN